MVRDRGTVSVCEAGIVQITIGLNDITCIAIVDVEKFVHHLASLRTVSTGHDSSIAPFRLNAATLHIHPRVVDSESSISSERVKEQAFQFIASVTTVSITHHDDRACIVCSEYGIGKLCQLTSTGSIVSFSGFCIHVKNIDIKHDGVPIDWLIEGHCVVTVSLVDILVCTVTEVAMRFVPTYYRFICH